MGASGASLPPVALVSRIATSGGGEELVALAELSSFCAAAAAGGSCIGALALAAEESALATANALAFDLPTAGPLGKLAVGLQGMSSSTTCEKSRFSPVVLFCAVAPSGALAKFAWLPSSAAAALISGCDSIHGLDCSSMGVGSAVSPVEIIPPAGTVIGWSMPGTEIVFGTGGGVVGGPDIIKVPGALIVGPPFANSAGAWYEGSDATVMSARGCGGLAISATPGSGRSSTTFAHLSNFSATPTAISACS